MAWKLATRSNYSSLTHLHNGKVWVDMTMLAKTIGVHINCVRRQRSGYKKFERCKFRVMTKGGLQAKVFCLREEAALLLARSRKPIPSELLSLFDLRMISACTEATHIPVIADAFSHFDPKTQHSIGSYRIDLYLAKPRIAVECDERNHSDRDREYENRRQTVITDALNCSFVRFNPDSPGFSIGKVINEILMMMPNHNA